MKKLKALVISAPGNVRCHVDLLINKPTIEICYSGGSIKEIIRNGDLT